LSNSKDYAIYVIEVLREVDAMNVSVGERWQEFVDEIVRSGRYGSASEVVREGLRLVEEREAKLQALRDTLNASIADGGSLTDEEVGAAIDEELEKMSVERG
jgi:antitoxin ParD1/3/4